MSEYITVKKESSDEFEVKHSRFIGYVKPVTTSEEAIAYINEIKSKHWDAKHNVYAYVLREGQTRRYSDDGEPQGTAGMPVLDVILKEGVTDCVIVVTRYFGGVLLGGGGLVRAYSHAASIALQAGGITKMLLFSICNTTVDYTLYNRLQALVSSYGGKIIDSDFADTVSLKFSVPKDSFDSFQKKFTDLSFGKASIDTMYDAYFEAS